MIVGTGIDIVALSRIERLYERHGERVYRHLLTPAETDAIAALANPVTRLAGRFAAKEAVLKALGTGWARGIGFTQIEILNDEAGAPRITLLGRAAERCAELGGRVWHLSISHEREMAVAMAILES